MSVALNTGDILEASIVCTLAEQASINKVHYFVQVVLGAPTDAQAALAIDTAIQAQMKLQLSQDATYLGVGIQRLFPGNRTSMVNSKAFTAIGGVVGNALPRQTAGLLTVRTARAGRAYRGRFYVPFPAVNSNNVGGLPSAAYGTGINLLGGILLGPIAFGSGGNTGALGAIIWHSKTRLFDTATSIAFLKLAWATQRRRGSYGKPNTSPF